MINSILKIAGINRSKLLLSIFLLSIQYLNAQCTWHTLLTDSYEYTTVCPDIIPGTTYQSTPQTFAAHTGSRSLYLNFVNCVGGVGSCAGTLAYQRTITVCPNLQMRLSAWLTTTFGGTQCNVHLKIVDANNIVLVNTPSVIPAYHPAWTQYNSGVFTPTTATIKFLLYTNVGGGGGNDLSMDDFLVENCYVNPTPVSINHGTICSNTLAFNMYPLLTNSPVATGTWAGPSTLINGNLGTFTPSTNTSGTYTYTTYPYGASATCPVENDNVTVTVAAAPVMGATVTPSANVCNGTSVTLNGTGAAGYGWSGGVGNGVPFIATTTTTYTVTGINGNGCTDTFTQTVTVNPIPVVGITVAPATTVCFGDLVTLSGTGASTYTWSGGIIDATAFSATATTTYTVTGTDANGCTNTASQNINVNALPIVGSTVFPGNTVCTGTNVTLSGTGATTYSWSGGITDATPFSPATNATYTVTGTDANGCSNTSTETININAPPAITVAVNPSASVCFGTNVTLTGSGAATYTWSGGITDATPFVANATTTYTVTGTDGNGCTNTATQLVTVNALPTIGVTVVPTATVCSNTNVTLSGTGATTYTWTGGITDATPFAATVTTTYTVTGTDGNGCTNTNSQLITVNPLPTITITVSLSAAVCAGTNVTLSGGGANAYTWTGGVINATPFAPATTNTYTVTGTDINGCINTASQLITVNQPPTVSSTVSPAATVCSGTNITLTGTGANTYSWTGGVVNATPFAATNTTTYTVTGTDANGCTSTSTQTITVNQPPIVGTSVSPSALVCIGSNVTLSGTGANTYTWSGGINNAVAFPATATTTYTVTGTTNGCSATASITITVSPNVNLTVTSASICTGQSATLTATGALNYTWSPAVGLNTTNGNTVIAEPLATQTYTVTGTANACSGTALSVVTVYQKPAISYFISPQSGNAPLNVSFSNLTPGVTTCIWNFGDGTFSTSQNTSNIYTLANTYTGSLYVTNTNNCSDSIQFTILVENNSTLYIPNAFTPNGDGINDVFIPKGESIQDFEMSIYNNWGEEIYNTKTIDKPWDGRYKENFCQIGVYVYKISVTNYAGDTKNYKGKVTLIK